MEHNIIIAGFGGQGVLFAGKILTVCGLSENKEVSWLPSYGPEMKGGTANCSVVISDREIGSPLVTSPDILIAMNVQSFDKFLPALKPDGVLIYDSSLIHKEPDRSDIKAFSIPASKIASDNELAGLSNVIILGFLTKHTSIFSKERFSEILAKSTPKSKEHLKALNQKAFELGFNY